MQSANIRELARRCSENLEVSLLWNRRSGRVSITVYDAATEEEISLTVPRDRALDAFNHPYAYLLAS
jgi:hypothetical protein